MAKGVSKLFSGSQSEPDPAWVEPSKVDEFIEWCKGLEWAAAGRPDSRDALLGEVVKRAKSL